MAEGKGFETINFKNYSMPTYIKHNCFFCKKDFKITLSANTASTNKNVDDRFCSKKCHNKFQKQKHPGAKSVNCKECSIAFRKRLSQIKRSKSGNHFCSKSCAAKFNNKNKKTGTRRSKLETWLENNLISKYPNIEFHFNRKDAINSELDIYLPSLNLAFELNGIFHYEPIFGKEKLANIKNNDNRKMQACLERNIELCIIDTSSQKYFKERSSQKFLNIICNIIEQKLSDS